MEKVHPLTPSREAILQIIRACGLAEGRVPALLAVYYLLTPAAALADGLSWLLLLRVFSFSATAVAEDPSALALERLLSGAGLPSAPGAMLLAAAALFILKGALTVAVSSLEYILQADCRRKVQERCFERILFGRWDALQHVPVGRWVGALTEEASTFSKYLLSYVRAAYAAVTFLLLGAMAFWVAPKLAVLAGAAGIPAWAALRYLYAKQTDLSGRQARERQGLAADITERLTGLFQIKAAREAPAHLKAGMRRQGELTRLEVVLGYFGGAIIAFNTFMIAAFLLLFWFWSRSHASPAAGLGLMGSVGILGFRAVGQLNQLIASVGNLSRLVGCVEPVRRLAVIVGETQKAPLPEPLSGVRLAGVSYSFGGNRVLDGLNVSISPGKLFLIMGPSGAGKTTMANLIAGLYDAAAGEILYEGPSGKTYPAARHRPRIGYVTQDVHLFRGSVRDNLDPEHKLPDEQLWRCVRDSGAGPFVERLGGLDAEIAEAGRSLSGGERRRVAIARALAQDADGLILDEVTNGLEQTNRQALLETIGKRSQKILIVAITHDRAAFDGAESTVFTLRKG